MQEVIFSSFATIFLLSSTPFEAAEGNSAQAHSISKLVKNHAYKKYQDPKPYLANIVADYAI